MPRTIVPPEHDASLHAFAVAHVQRVRGRCPQFRHVDEAAFVAAVISHLAPLSADRPFRRAAAFGRRGEASWIGGAVGLHIPRARAAP